MAFLVSGAPGWRTRRLTQGYDLSDPTHPVKIRDFGLVGQEPGATGTVPADRRPREADSWTEGADAGKFAVPGDRAPQHVAAQRRAYDLPDVGHADRRVRQGQ